MTIAPFDKVPPIQFPKDCAYREMQTQRDRDDQGRRQIQSEKVKSDTGKQAKQEVK
jgi:hypothetical protein